MPKVTQNGQSSMCHGNEAPSTKLDIGQSFPRIAKAYPDLL